MREYSVPKKMKKVGDLFSKYKTHFKPPQASVEKACSIIIKETTGFNVSTDQMIYTVGTKTLSLQIPSILKSEMKLKYPLILKRLEEKLGKNEAPSVIF